MASMCKRKWQSKSETRIAWIVDFIDASGKRYRKQFDARGEADAFRIKVEGELDGGSYRASAGTHHELRAIPIY